MDKLVVHYRKGYLTKGHALDFSATKPSFHFLPLKGELIEVHLSELKAVFFVRDFRGDPSCRECAEYPAAARAGEVAVTFSDGEVIRGEIPAPRAKKPGFFLFPADPRSNNVALYGIYTAVRSIDPLRPSPV